MNLGADTMISWADRIDRRSELIRKAKTRALRRSAAYVWRVAKNSIKRKTKKEKHTWTDEHGRQREALRWVASPAGTPAYDHHGWKRTMHFELNADGDEAYIGPIEGRKHLGPTLEFGGAEVVRWKTWDGGHQVQRSKQVRIKPRPTMGLALDKSQARLVEFWKGVVR